MRVIIYSQVYKVKDQQYIQEIFDVLADLNTEIFVYGPYFEQISNKIKFKVPTTLFESSVEVDEILPDFLISIGGDGTILNAVTLIGDRGVPVLGINVGRLGFLANTDKREIRQALGHLKNGMYDIDRRSLLHLDSNVPLFNGHCYALNDFTILKRDTSSMIVVHTYINGEFLNSYWADGIILATPTGSTGYSLSCGGPIIYPNSGNFVITPVAPHNLYVRPFVISDDCVVSFEIEGRVDQFLCTLDSRFEHINANTLLAIRKEKFAVNLVRIGGSSFLPTLRKKLFWGSDTRN